MAGPSFEKEESKPLLSFKHVYRKYHTCVMDTGFAFESSASVESSGLVRCIAVNDAHTQVVYSGHGGNIHFSSLPHLTKSTSSMIPNAHTTIINVLTVVNDDQLRAHDIHLYVNHPDESHRRASSFALPLIHKSVVVVLTESKKEWSRWSSFKQQSCAVREYLLSASDDCLIKLWDCTTFELLRTYSNHTAGVNVVKIFCFKHRPAFGTAPTALCGTQAPLLITGADDNLARIIDFTTGKVLRTLKGHTDIVFCADYTHAYTSSGPEFIPIIIVVTGSRDKTIRVFNGETSECFRVLFGHIGIVRSVKLISQDRILSCSGDYRIKLWNFMSGECTETIIAGDTCGMFWPKTTAVFLTSTIDGSAGGSIAVWKKPPGIQALKMTFMDGTNPSTTAGARIWRIIQARDMVITSCSDKTLNVLSAKMNIVDVPQKCPSLVTDGQPSNHNTIL